ncbi:MAG: DUF2142 domain-containing protein, partial [Saccharofermentans sp.]|nr:DUF2142 domain-containing protein [Saccharofermentans sp.]
MNKKHKTVLIFFILVALITTAFFVIGLKHSSYPKYAYTFNSMGPTETVELYKFKKAECDVTFLGDICGLSLGSFNSNGAYTGDEALRFIVRDKKTGTEMLCYDYKLCEHQYDDARVFIPFEYHADEETTWHIEVRCVDIAREHPVTVSLTDGELYMASVHRDIVKAPGKVVLYYILALLILAFGAYLYFVKKLPFANGEPDLAPKIAKPSIKKVIAGLVVIDIAFAIIACLVYTDTTVRLTKEKDNEFAAALCDIEPKDATDPMIMDYSVVMLVSPDVEAGTNINYKVTDIYSGRLLEEGSIEADKLETASERFSMQENYYRVEETDLSDYLVMEYNIKPLSRSLDGRSTAKLELSFEDGRDHILRSYGFTNRSQVTNMLFMLLILSCMLVNVLYLINALRPIGIAKNYLIAALCLGLIMSILIPHICVPDERYHMDNCYKMSDTILGVEDPLYPGKIMKRITEIDNTEAATAEVRPAKYNQIYFGLMQKTEETEYVPSFGNTSQVTNAPSVCYLPGAIGITIARALELNGVSAMYFARWMTLLAVTLAIFIAVRKMPAAKAAMACAALIPMSLQEIASTSYDGFIIATAFIFTAYSTFIVTRPDRRNALDWMVTVGSALVLSLCKGGVYIPILGLIVLAEFTFANKAHAKLKKAGLIGLFALPVIAALIVKVLPAITKTVTSTTSHSSTIGGIKDVYTLGYAAKHVDELIALIARTLSAKGEVYLQSFIGGRLGMSVYVP